MAKLYYFYGTMNAGKSVNLIKDAYNYEETNRKAIVIKPKLDSRGKEGYISCRIEGMIREAILFEQEEDLFITLHRLINEAQDNGEKVGAIFVDEAQFLTKEQVFQLSHVPDYMHIPVLCYGLRTDAFGKAFEGSLALFELADEMKEIKSMCVHTNSKATMVYRIDSNGNPVKNGDTIDVGGNDKYKACSRKAYKQVIHEISGIENLI